MREAQTLPNPRRPHPGRPRSHAGGRFTRLGFSLLGTAVIAATQLACQPATEPAPGGKMPITTSSPAALDAYVTGRDLGEKLRATDARQYYVEAVRLDPDFALAHLGLAMTAPTATELFESLRRATELAEVVTPGEAHFIRSVEAGINGEPESRREHLAALVAAFPQDERAHNLLGVFHHGRQEWQEAIVHYRRAIEINPGYSPPYNLLGYALRFLGQLDGAEEALKKYIDLNPGEPNPYDSYAELLLQMGRFKDSIAAYKIALDIDPNFSPSYVGTGNALICLGKPAEARKVFTKLRFIARNDAEKRQAHGWVAVSHIHEQDFEAALRELASRLRVAEHSEDGAAVAGDLNLIGEVLLEAGKPDQALAKFREAVTTMQAAQVTDEVKAAAQRSLLRNTARVALAVGDIEKASADAQEYSRLAEEHQIPGELRLSHELWGSIAFAREDYQEAARELEQANQQDPRVLYLKALAYVRAGDTEAAREPAERAANFNAISLNYAFIKADAEALLAKLNRA